jgi:hypothetical protein
LINGILPTRSVNPPHCPPRQWWSRTDSQVFKRDWVRPATITDGLAEL